MLIHFVFPTNAYTSSLFDFLNYKEITVAPAQGCTGAALSVDPNEVDIKPDSEKPWLLIKRRKYLRN